ncbi:MAG: hypothetical protein WBP54_01605 [Pelodictyon phaeoclathratiforme]
MNVPIYLKRKSVKNNWNHHVIVSYGAFGKALASELFKNRHQKSVNREVVAIDKLKTGDHDESNLMILYCDALRVDLAKALQTYSARVIEAAVRVETEGYAIR